MSLPANRRGCFAGAIDVARFAISDPLTPPATVALCRETINAYERGEYREELSAEATETWRSRGVSFRHRDDGCLEMIDVA